GCACNINAIPSVTMPTNVTPEYRKAEQAFRPARSTQHVPWKQETRDSAFPERIRNRLSVGLRLCPIGRAHDCGGRKGRECSIS
ncbi:MAG: hypothetical protein ACREBC_26100, partial [Pyrinomonadaceae bacterium]